MSKIRELAPVVVTVYDRLEHFENCIAHLLLNNEAIETELYIFSDAPREGDEELVGKVRDFCRTIKGFKVVHLNFREKNDYIENIEESIFLPLSRHGKVIWLEDDNLVSPAFLHFMNAALTFYKDFESVLGIGGYAPPIEIERFTSQKVYMSKIFSAWGYATWADRGFEEYFHMRKPHSDLKFNKLSSKVREVHPRLPRFLKLIERGAQYAPDRLLTYNLIKSERYQVRPVKSLVKNIGHDGSGLNCVPTSKFDQDFSLELVDEFELDCQYHPEIDRSQYRYFYPSLWRRIRGRLISICHQFTAKT